MAEKESQPSERETASLIDNLCRREGNFALFADMNSDNLELILSNSEGNRNPESFESVFILSPFDSREQPIVMPVDSHFKGEETLQFLHSLGESKLIENSAQRTETEEAIQDFNSRHK